MLYKKTGFEFGLPVDVSIDSLPVENTFSRDLKIIWVLRGQLSLELEVPTVNESNKKQIFLKDNNIFLINSLIPYKLLKKELNSGKAEYYVVTIKNSVCRKHISEFDNKIFYITRTNSEEDNLKQLRLEDIRYLLANLIKNYKEDYIILQKIEFIIQEILRIISENFCINNKRNDDFFNKYYNDIIFTVLYDLDDKYREKINLKDLAEKYHYNTSYISEKFKKMLGLNFKDYLDQLRLYGVMQSLLYTNKNISQISLENGFSSLKSFYRAFNIYYNYSPVEYRDNFEKIKDKMIMKMYSNVGFQDNKVNEYLNKDISFQGNSEKNIEKEVIVNCNETHGNFSNVWRKVINIGTAFSILDSNKRAQIEEIQKDIGFKYLRFEGVFNDEMEVCSGDSVEDINYSWKLVDKVFDFLLKVNLKPFISLSFMPKILASKDKTMFYYQANFSPPVSMTAWLNLVHAFIIHLINRYGIGEVNQWYFQIWTEFSHNGFHWAGTDEEYFQFYEKTVQKIKDISQQLKVGPASENFFLGFTKSTNFLEYCSKKDLPVDFYNLNIYHNLIPKRDKNIDLNEFYRISTLNSGKFTFEEKDHSVITSKRMKVLIDNYYPDSEIIVTRWNFSWNTKEYIHDTVFMADFIIDNVLKIQNYVDALGYLTLSDNISEWPIDESPFFGGRGLINTEGIKKAAYYAFMFLSKLGSNIVDQGENYIITRNNNDIQILLYNYTYINESYKYADYSMIDEKNRYDVFTKKKKIDLEITLNHLKGKYKITQYYLNRETGSAFDEWVKMGSPYELNNEEIQYLKYKSYPEMRVDYLDLMGDIQLSSQLDVHHIKLITLKKMYEL